MMGLFPKDITGIVRYLIWKHIRLQINKYYSICFRMDGGDLTFITTKLSVNDRIFINKWPDQDIRNFVTGNRRVGKLPKNY